jgi:D-arabinose 1-dehydrogenase-like Zn-dependent alcohol dehydrogenase
MEMDESTTTFAVQDEAATGAKTYPAKAYWAQSATSGLAPANINRRTPRAQDVQIQILYCGVCHSDLHQVRNEWRRFIRVFPVTKLLGGL